MISSRFVANLDYSYKLFIWNPSLEDKFTEDERLYKKQWERKRCLRVQFMQNAGMRLLTGKAGITIL